MLSPPRWPRVIFHADMDAFYAAIEQLDDPSLVGRPVLIGHPGDRGVVATASYEARPYGVGSAMPMAVARRRCPDAVIVPPRMDRYVDASRAVMETFGRFSPLVEPLSLDEAFLDMTGTEGLFGPPEEAARRLKRAVVDATGGLKVSVGVATCKYVAKVASDLEKPDGLTVVESERTLQFLDPLPISRLWGLGPRGQERVGSLGLETIGDVARADPDWLERELGSLGPHIWRLANADDTRDVVSDRDPKSVSAEMTLEHDIRGRAAVWPHLRHAADRVARRLRAAGIEGRGVRVKLKTAEFRIHTRQRRLSAPSAHADELLRCAASLLDRFDLTEPMRLVGLGAYDLVEAGSGRPAQGDFFDDDHRSRDQALDRALDGVHERFGLAALKRASDLDEP